jgi:UDP:flavonoid glycosyltransferase YjiC (YdhE family)
MLKQKRILVAPLDWGLGHASRCIPIIHELKNQGAEVIVGASNKPLQLLLKEFPNIEHVELPGMNISYPKFMPMSVYMGIRAPRFLKWVKEEQELLRSIVDTYNIHGVISDNRYGLFHKSIPTVLITHQLYIKASVLSKALERITFNYASRHTFCWVPDNKGEPNLSGELSHGDRRLNNLRYVGLLSRFNIPDYYKPIIRYDLLVILSGPEPSRTILEKTVLKQLIKSDLKVLFVRGLVNSEPRVEDKVSDNIVRINYFNSEELQKAILISKVVLCRSGYSSIMDLSVLKKKVIFVPTQGQTEQFYLAKKLKKEKRAFYTTRANLNIGKSYKKALQYDGLDMDQNPDLLIEAISDFLKLVH